MTDIKDPEAIQRKVRDIIAKTVNDLMEVGATREAAVEIMLIQAANQTVDKSTILRSLHYIFNENDLSDPPPVTG